jgi:hypothetical protein
MNDELRNDPVAQRADLMQLESLASDLDVLVELVRGAAAAEARPGTRVAELAATVAGTLAFLRVPVPEGPRLLDPLRAEGPCRIPVRAAGGVVTSGGVLDLWVEGYRVLAAGVRARIRALQAAAGK